MNKCKECQNSFQITQDDRDFYDNVSPIFGGEKYLVPEPTQCPSCRQRQRLAFRNLRSVYLRKCDLTGKSILSTFDKNCQTPVYSADAWWGDDWDALSYGRNLDFSRPFFDQFSELYHEVPILQNSVLLVENCDYINGAANCKDCYLCFNMDYCEKCYYITECKHMLSCVDCLSSNKCELCYECVSCENCYNLKYSRRSRNCNDSYFLADCKQCKNCIACDNLVGKEYYIFNKQVTPEEFKKFKERLQNYSKIEKVRKIFEEFILKFPKKYYYGHSNENFSGDRIQNVKNCHHCFDTLNLENCKYCYYLFDSKNCMDHDLFGDNSEWMYNCLTSGLNCSNDLFCMFTWNSSSFNIYCHLLSGSSHNFGCSGLKQKKYCILNKQYSKDEFEKMVPEIIEHMKSTGEWSNFFPAKMSHFGYNETQSAEFHPLTKEEAIKNGFNWKNIELENNPGTKTIPGNKLPNNIDDVPDEILDWAIECETTGRLFKIIPQELKFYREHKLPIPHFNSEERHKRRIKLQNPRHLYDRKCDKCHAAIKSSYSDNQAEIIYCEVCYQKEVY